MRRIRPKMLLVMILAILSLGISGCGIRYTAPNAQEAPPKAEEKHVDPNGWSAILDAINKNHTVTKFGMNGNLYVRERGRTHLSSIYGNVIMPDQIVMSQSVDGRSYYIFQDKQSSYYREDGAWRPSTRVQLPDIWASLERLTKMNPPTVYRLKDQILISSNTHVYQLEADAVPLAGFPVPEGKAVPTLYTFYIDTKTHYLMKIEMESVSGVDDVGTFVTNASIQFFSLNDDNLKVEMPPELKNQLKEEAKRR
jgi:hypothetical protein